MASQGPAPAATAAEEVLEVESKVGEAAVEVPVDSHPTAEVAVEMMVTWRLNPSTSPVRGSWSVWFA